MNLDRWLMFDEPVPYKDLLIYPVSMRDFMIFHFYAKCLLLEKNSLIDPVMAVKAISMSYLEYMYTTSDPDAMDERNLVALFDGLLRLVLRLSKETEIGYLNYGFDANHKPLFKVGETYYDARDFDEIRDIVSRQNELELPNESIQKNVRDQMEYARRYKARLAGNKVAGLEDQIIGLSIFTGWDIEKIYDMSIRKFVRALKRANHMIYQDAYLKAQLSGMVEFKDKSIVKGWLADIDEENNNDVFMDLDNLQGKVNETKKS